MTRDSLIQQGLDGKDKAIAAYDQILWKIRAGYAVVLYGVFTLVVSLGDTGQWKVSTEIAGLVAIVLITGFTVSIAALDISFLSRKYRVVQSKEELIDLALSLATEQNPGAWECRELRDLTILLHIRERQGQGSSGSTGLRCGRSRYCISGHGAPFCWQC